MNGPFPDRNDESEESQRGMNHVLLTAEDEDQDRSLELAGSDFLLGC